MADETSHFLPLLSQPDRASGPSHLALRTALVGVALVVGCVLAFAVFSPTSAPGHQDDVTKQAVPQQGDEVLVELTGEETVKEVRAHVGDKVVVQIKGNPTTGFRWSESLTQADTGLLKVFEDYVSGSHSAGVTGVGGCFVFHYRANTAGAHSVSLDYKRPWETSTAPARSIKLLVTVQ